MSEIPKEHQLECRTCGKILDMRDLGQVLAHGWWNESQGRYVCDDQPRDVEYTASRKVGDQVEWSRDKKPTNLN